MRVRAVVASLLACGALVAGCAGGEGSGDADCASVIRWNGSTYWGITARVEVGGSLGEGVSPACNDSNGASEEDSPVEIFAVRGVDPAIAVTTASDVVYTADGFVLESQAHPLHDAIFDPGEPNERRGWTCEEPLTVGATVASPPGHGVFRVRDVTAHEDLFRATDDGRVSLDAKTEITGLERKGVPYIAGEEKLVLTVRACSRGERLKLVADRMEAPG